MWKLLLNLVAILVVLSASVLPELAITQKNKRPQRIDSLLDRGLAAFHANNYALAYRLLKPMVAKGEVEATTAVAYMFNRGAGVERDHVRARTLYRFSAERGDRYAQNNLGKMLLAGDGGPQDLKEAHSWFLMSAEQDNANAMISLSNMYLDGKGVKRDYKRSLNWLEKAAALDRDSALVWLGIAHQEGVLLREDLVQAARYLKEGAEKGQTSSMVRYGRALEDGDGVSRDRVAANGWYLKAFTIDEDANAAFNLGYNYRYGIGVSKNLAEGRRWLKMAAERGSSQAKDELAKHP